MKHRICQARHLFVKVAWVPYNCAIEEEPYKLCSSILLSVTEFTYIHGGDGEYTETSMIPISSWVSSFLCKVFLNW
jgi:hypothetical protein